MTIIFHCQNSWCLESHRVGRTVQCAWTTAQCSLAAEATSSSAGSWLVAPQTLSRSSTAASFNTSQRWLDSYEVTTQP